MRGVSQRPTFRRGGGMLDPTAVRPHVELEFHRKKELIPLDRRKPMISSTMVLGQLVTSEVRSKRSVLEAEIFWTLSSRPKRLNSCQNGPIHSKDWRARGAFENTPLQFVR